MMDPKMQGVCLGNAQLYKRFNETGSCQKQKVPVDQAQVQQALNECVNHFNKVTENQFDTHPENWEDQPPLHRRMLHKRLKLYAYKVQILQELKPNDGPQMQGVCLGNAQLQRG